MINIFHILQKKDFINTSINPLKQKIMTISGPLLGYLIIRGSQELKKWYEKKCQEKNNK